MGHTGPQLLLNVLQQDKWRCCYKIPDPAVRQSSTLLQKLIQLLQLLLLQHQHLGASEQHTFVYVAAAETPTLQGQNDCSCLKRCAGSNDLA